jgi:hypothetical protein
MGVTGINDDWCKDTVEVIEVSLGISHCTRVNFGYTWENLVAPATSLREGATLLEAPQTHLGALAPSQGAPVISQGAPATTLGAPRCTVE